MSESPLAQFPTKWPGKGGPIVAIAGLVVVLIVGYVFWLWSIERVVVRPNHLMVIVNKTGETVPAELQDPFTNQVVLYPGLVDKIAAQTREDADYVRKHYKGIRYEVITEGRHFFNPYFYQRIASIPATIIKDNEVGVQIRKYGRPLPPGKTVATEPDEQGPVAEILRPGRYNINPLAYDVQRFPALDIPPGHVGVVTLLSGNDPEEKNTYTVGPDEMGVQRQTLGEGLVYYNPYLKHVEIVDLRSHKYDMRGDDAIHFPSTDSFTITMEGTIEWAIQPHRVAEVTVAYGDEQHILKKIILPNARSIARIQGSKLKAREFISGTTRQQFQDRLREELAQECGEQGINIRAALVRDIKPPSAIAGPISEREQAEQEIERARNQMEEAKAEAKLVVQKERQEQNRSIGDANKSVVTVVKKAEQEMVVAVTEAQRDLEVASLDLQAARRTAEARRAAGKADANVILFDYAARAEPLAAAVAAFGDGHTYAQQFFLLKTAPSIHSILTNTEGPFAEVFKQFNTFKPVAEQQSAPPKFTPPDIYELDEPEGSVDSKPELKISRQIEESLPAMPSVVSDIEAEQQEASADQAAETDTGSENGATATTAAGEGGE